ncbi:MAG: ribonuclease P protein component [Bacteroidales bacterium]|nr:ribonuclease P protein component [Bacteroidales bacterium]
MNPEPPYCFTKSERLSGQLAIDLLFKQGKPDFIYPYKIIYRVDKQTTETHLRILISVSRKNFKKAVDRNRIKRLTREAWRKNKFILAESLGRNHNQMDIALIFIAKSIPLYKETEDKIILILQRLKKAHEHHRPNSIQGSDSID